MRREEEVRRCNIVQDELRNRHQEAVYALLNLERKQPFFQSGDELQLTCLESRDGAVNDFAIARRRVCSLEEHAVLLASMVCKEMCFAAVFCYRELRKIEVGIPPGAKVSICDIRDTKG